MRNVARALAGIIALLYLLFGIRYMFLPAGVMEAGGLASVLDPINVVGMATARGLIGGGFLAFGILLVMHTVVNQETGALRFTILHLLMTIVGRVVSVVADGTGPETMRNFVPVTLMLIVSIVSLVMFLRSEEAS